MVSRRAYGLTTAAAQLLAARELCKEAGVTLLSNVPDTEDPMWAFAKQADELHQAVEEVRTRIHREIWKA